MPPKDPEAFFHLTYFSFHGPACPGVKNIPDPELEKEKYTQSQTHQKENHTHQRQAVEQFNFLLYLLHPGHLLLSFRY